MVKNWLKEGIVFHERLKPFHHRFSYKVFYLKFPLESLDKLKNRFFSINRFNLLSLYEKDYLDGSKRPLDQKLAEVLAPLGIFDYGQVILQTFPRVLGYGFNPVSFWCIFNKQDQLFCVLAEVNNTFGDRHYYLLTEVDGKTQHVSNKEFHVSPFFDIKGEYHFVLSNKKVEINYFDKEESNYFFKSFINEVKSFEWNEKNLLAMIFRYPLLSFLIMARIHWQAFKLFVKRAPFFSRPQPPQNILTKENT